MNDMENVFQMQTCIWIFTLTSTAILLEHCTRHISEMFLCLTCLDQLFYLLFICLSVCLPILPLRAWWFPGFGFRRNQLQSFVGQDSLWQEEISGDAQQDLRYSSRSDAGHRRGGEIRQSFQPLICVMLTEVMQAVHLRESEGWVRNFELNFLLPWW